MYQLLYWSVHLIRERHVKKLLPLTSANLYRYAILYGIKSDFFSGEKGSRRLELSDDQLVS